MTRRILIIGMLDSVHLANWVSRIMDQDIEVIIFPSRKYRKIHAKLKGIIKNHNNIKTINSIRLLPTVGVYFEALLDQLAPSALFRAKRLERVLEKNDIEVIHGIEFQSAGYLLLKVRNIVQPRREIIITNWGSDIYFYQNDPVHESKIRDLLCLADSYSAECIRDYELASQYGFKGKFLPIVPNSASFSDEFFLANAFSRSTPRELIIMKCYGEKFGLGEQTLTIAKLILERFEFQKIFAYSITSDIVKKANALKDTFPERFEFTTIDRPISHDVLLSKFNQSKIYVGLSRSDGVSTSFLEAVACGVYPIQTKTSCANEWIERGARGSIVGPDTEQIFSIITNLLNNENELKEAQEVNQRLSKKLLNFKSISLLSQSFYGV